MYTLFHRCFPAIALMIVLSAGPGNHLNAQSGPTIGSFDWKERWIVNSRNDCSRSPQGYYLGEAILNNLGTSDDEILKLEIVDHPSYPGDAAFFALDTTNPLMWVRPGDILVRNGGRPLKQLLRFAPKDERIYKAWIVLTPKAGAPVHGILEGYGLESHGVANGADFGIVEYLGPSNPTTGTPPVPGQVRLRAFPPDTLRVTGIDVREDSTSSFYIPPAQFAGAKAFPWVVLPGEEKTIDVEFRPQISGTQTARLFLVVNLPICGLPAILTGTASSSSSAERAPESSDILSDIRIKCTPNPMQSSTQIHAAIAEPGQVRIEIFDELGRSIRVLADREMETGEHVVPWDGTDGTGRRCPTGTYGCLLTIGDRAALTQIVLQR